VAFCKVDHVAPVGGKRLYARDTAKVCDFGYKCSIYHDNSKHKPAYVHVCVFLLVYVYVCTCARTYDDNKIRTAYMNVCRFLIVYVSVHVYVHINVYVYMNVYLHVCEGMWCLCTCMCIYMYMFVTVYVYAHVYAYVCMEYVHVRM